MVSDNPLFEGAIVFHAPHTSMLVPERYRTFLQLDDDELQHELNRLTDHRIDELLIPPSIKHGILKAPISRILIDMERFPDDALEPAARVGMGIIYTKTTTGAVLRHPPSPIERKELMDRFYTPHHEHLHALTKHALQQRGATMILDLHSFPSVPLPTENPGGGVRPDICIGVDDFHTPPTLIDRLHGAFTRTGLRVAIDDPFSGTMVPSDFYRSDPRIMSVMIEVNRRIYLDDSETIASSEFKRIGAILQACIAEALRDFKPPAGDT